ncbi:Uncharacterized protein TCM_017320 [Theobroma cacao]|uniref:Uncharacterized protein n=1 Tax=Theobroma cacao TaxID=3641 RepID=A0A061EDA9_THECC|nr:Uncharacterized protein TCM_017320 [Theobroma cacao]
MGVVFSLPKSPNAIDFCCKKMQNFCNTWKLSTFHSSAISWLWPNHPYPPTNTSHFSTLTLNLNSGYFPLSWVLSLPTLHKITHQRKRPGIHIAHLSAEP